MDTFLSDQYGLDLLATTWDFPETGEHIMFDTMTHLIKNVCGESVASLGRHAL